MQHSKRIAGSAAFALFAAALLSMPACTKNYFYTCPSDGGSQNGITLSSEVQFGSQARLQDDQIFNGQSLSLFVTRTGSVTDANQLYANNRITANGAGGFAYRIPMYYPSDGTAVDFYAIHPYSAVATLSSPLTFTVQADQTQQANYLNSDLLFGSKSNVTPQVNAVPLTFYHKLSKLDFIITTRSASIDLNRLTGITVLGTLPQMTIDIQSGSRTTATGTPTTIQAYGSATVSGTVGDQTATGFTAIIVPQTAPGEQQLFGLTIDGRTMYHTLADDFGFASGSKYAIRLEVSDTGIALSSQIAEWTDGGSIGGTAGPR